MRAVTAAPIHPSRYALLLLAAALLCAATLAAPASVHAQAAPADLDAEEQRALDRLNEERTQRGLEPLTISPALSEAAEWMAGDLSRTAVIGHVDSDGRSMRERVTDFGYPERSTVRENVAAGFETGDGVMQGWMDSPGHRANNLADDVTVVGLARVYEAGTQYEWFWALDFGSVDDGANGDANADDDAADDAADDEEDDRDGFRDVRAEPSQNERDAVLRVDLRMAEEEGDPEDIVERLSDDDCSAVSVWLTLDGSFVGYLPGSPEFVNAEFPTRVDSGTPFIAVCV